MSTMNIKSLSTISQLDFNELLLVLRGKGKAEYHPKKHKKQSCAAQNKAAKKRKGINTKKKK